MVLYILSLVYERQSFELIIHGCRFPDKAAGQVPMAYIVQKPGNTLSEISVIDFVTQQVFCIVNPIYLYHQ